MKKQSAAAACVTALLLLTTACGKAEEPALPLPQEEQVKTICQLAVLECEYHNLAKYQDGQKVERFLWMTKGKRFWVEYSATAVLGINADQVSMKLQGDVVSITLPRARVLNCKVNGDSLSKDSYIVDKDSAPVTAEDEVRAFKDAQDSLQQTVEADGDMLKSALINAQRMGENVIREANQKAEEILHRANLRGDDVIRDANELLQKASDRADEIINEANEKKLAEEREYDRVRLEVTRFKSDVLNLYRSHVESLSRLPEFQKEEAPAEEPEESAAEDEVEETTAELNEKLDNAADAKAPETAEADDAAEDGDAEKSEDFWEKDESQLKLDPPPADAAPTAPDYAAFQGVKFSE